MDVLTQDSQHYLLFQHYLLLSLGFKKKTSNVEEQWGMFNKIKYKK